MEGQNLRVLISAFIGLFMLAVPDTDGAAAILKRSTWSPENFSAGVTYMKKYGWMPPPDPEASELITEMEMRRSIAHMQRFFRLPVTGQMDDKTMKLMQRPRCGVPDVDVDQNGFRSRRYSINQNLKWGKTDLTYSFENYTPDMHPTQIRTSIENALKVWSDVTPLRFNEISRDGIADIEIMFAPREHGDGFTFDGRGGTLAHAFFPGEGIGGDAHFDDDEMFLYNTDVNGIDLFTVAAHELGHSMGLGHSENPAALMAPFYQGWNPDFRLDYDDIVGIQMLYGSNPGPRPPPREPEKPDVYATEPPPPPPPTTTQQPGDAVCSIKFDAISTIRGELFLFKGDQMWRTTTDGTPYPGYPTDIDLFWDNVADGITAVFERQNGLIVFVKGNEYWEFNGLTPTHARPKPMTDFGLPSSISIDAALPYNTEGKIYFFFETQVWKYDEYSRIIDEGYPKRIKKVWDIGNDLAAAFRFKEKTYFVKSKRYWKLNDTSSQIEPDYPRYFAVDWLGCPPPETDEYDTETDTETHNHGSRTLTSTLLILIPAAVLCLRSAVL
ncbi:stromelysin-1-like [Amphiura filiformis]|uniref:stromelysin-1-like n=1 Tax=Amphiura filiformis TaxID=82378 RepID=UPI003B20EA4F